MNKKTNLNTEGEEEEEREIAKFIEYMQKYAFVEKVMITGGDENGEPSTSTLIYDVTADSFQRGPEMTTKRRNHSSATLSAVVSCGIIIVCGGLDSGFDGECSCEMFDSETNSFGKIGWLNCKRAGNAAVALDDGSVFIFGGDDGETNHYHSVDMYDPTTGEFTEGESEMLSARSNHTANAISNERILICGGWIGYLVLHSTEIYDIKTDSFSAGPDLIVERCDHASTTLLDGRVLITGGSDINNDFDCLTSTEFYDPKTNSFIVGPQMLVARRGHSSSLLEDGRVLIIGGHGDASTTTEIYDPKTNSFTMGPKLPSGRCNHSASTFSTPFSRDIFTVTKLKIIN